MQIQWYPGHMARSGRLIAENLRLVDLVIELVDARIPRSSRNPQSPGIFRDRPCLVVMNKADLADPVQTRAWIRFFRERKEAGIPLESRTGKGLGELRRLAGELARPGLRARGMKRPVRLMVVGIPNVGKSSLLNRLVGRKSAAVGNRPGVTRGPQWVRLAEGMEILDTPGVLWPRFEDQQVGLKLAVTGAIRDEVFDRVKAAEWLIDLLNREASGALGTRYGLSGIETPNEWLEAIGRKRGLLAAGGQIDVERAAAALLEDYRSGRLGRITLEKPEEEGFGRNSGE